MLNEKKLFIITAPSGAGKSTLINKIIENDPSFVFSTSHTTRKPRGNEQNGKEYYFISKKEFEKKIKENDFLEYAEVHGNYYGTSIQEITRLQNEGKKVILDIDVQGSLYLQKKIKAVFIFISVKDTETLKQRLLKRNTDKPDEIEKRLKNAVWEVKQSSNWKHIVDNTILEKAIEDLKKILYS